MDKTVRGIFIEFYTTMFQGEPTPMSLNSNGRRYMDKALTDLKALLKSKMPKKREPSFKIGQQIETPTHKVASCVNTGFNQAIYQINQMIDEVMV